MRTKRLTHADLGWATDLLVNAFRGHPPVTQMFREPDASAKLTYFMECSCRYALLYSECYAPEDGSGVALWLLPGATKMTPLRMYRAGMLSAPFRLGMRDFKAFGAFARHTDRVHRAAVPQPHYYLFALGVRSGRQGEGIGAKLVQNMLERAREEGKPVYLETQSARNVPLYQRLGFDIVNDETIPQLALQNWGMVRR